jgi:hypothetical protein
VGGTARPRSAALAYRHVIRLETPCLQRVRDSPGSRFGEGTRIARDGPSRRASAHAEGPPHHDIPPALPVPEPVRRALRAGGRCARPADLPHRRPVAVHRRDARHRGHRCTVRRRRLGARLDAALGSASAAHRRGSAAGDPRRLGARRRGRRRTRVPTRRDGGRQPGVRDGRGPRLTCGRHLGTRAEAPDRGSQHQGGEAGRVRLLQRGRAALLDADRHAGGRRPLRAAQGFRPRHPDGRVQRDEVRARGDGTGRNRGRRRRRSHRHGVALRRARQLLPGWPHVGRRRRRHPGRSSDRRHAGNDHRAGERWRDAVDRQRRLRIAPHRAEEPAEGGGPRRRDGRHAPRRARGLHAAVRR